MKPSEHRVSPGILEFQPQLFLIRPFLQKVFVFSAPNVPIVKMGVGGIEGGINLIGMLGKYLSWDI